MSDDSSRAVSEGASTSWLTVALLALIVLAGAATRGYHLGAECFDEDELYAVRICGISPKTIAEVMARDGLHTNHPPLMTVPYLFWTRLFGTSEGAVRALPFLASLVTIVVVYRLGSVLAGRRVGLLAAALLALNPLHEAYAREARQYALLTLLVTLAHLTFLQVLRTGKQRYKLKYIVLCMLAALTHYFAVIALAAHALICVWLLLFGRREARAAGAQLLLCLTISAIPCLAWIPVVRYQSAQQWRHLMAADLRGIAGCLPDVLGVRTSWDDGVVGVAAAAGLIGAGLWGFARKSLNAVEPDGRAPLPRSLSLLILVGAVLLLLVLEGTNVSARLFAAARGSVSQRGTASLAIDQELRVLWRMILGVPVVLILAGVFDLKWSTLAAALRKLGESIKAEGREPGIPMIAASLILGPIVAMLALGLTGVSILQVRNLIVLVPALCLGIGMGLEALTRTRFGRGVAVGAAAVLLLGAFGYQPNSRLLGRTGQTLESHTEDWRRIGELRQTDPRLDLPLIGCKIPYTDPLPYYQKALKPERIASKDADSSELPGRFLLAHVTGDPDCSKLLDSVVGRGGVVVPKLQAGRLVVYEVELGAEMKSSSPARAERAGEDRTLRVRTERPVRSALLP